MTGLREGPPRPPKPLRRVVVTPGRIQDAWHVSQNVRAIALAPNVLEVLQELYQRPPMPFQTLYFEIGSEQAPHSDVIHFGSLPGGYMCAAWLALEDVDPGSGPLIYYPGSHRLPEFTMQDVGAAPLRHNYRLYERFISELIDDHHLEPRTAVLRKGQVGVWAANLLHGGSPIGDARTTRRSQVTHYYFEGCRYFIPIVGGQSWPMIAFTTLYRRLTRVR